jgi:hypothetical protein
MRPRLMIMAALAAIGLGGIMLVPAAVAHLRPDNKSESTGPGWLASTGKSPSPKPSPSPVPPTLQVRPVSVPVSGGFLSWALMDRKTGAIAGSPNITATNSTESMIKAWIVSDHLRPGAAAGKTPSAGTLASASRAIRDSDDKAAQSLYNKGGRNAVVARLITTCKLTDTKVYSGWWSRTRISARDAVRMGNCIADGRAAGPKWTKWVLSEMAQVRGTAAAKDQRGTSGGGRWGIIEGLPKEILAQGVSIKNGWTLVADGKWHINCLAISKDWVLAVLMQYPGAKGLPYGASLCKSVTQQLVVPGSVTTG